MQRVHVDTGSRSYDITVGRGALEEAAGMIRTLGCARVHIVTDANVAPLHLGKLEGLLDEGGIPRASSVLPAGEEHKTLAAVNSLYQDFFDAHLTRSDAVLALGGGVVGDVAGFAASTWMRGVPLIQIPTTVIAMVDSSVGGKTGVDLPQGKNLVGAFCQPHAVLADTSFLDTLPKREWRSGMAEVIKYCALGTPDLSGLIPDGDPERIIRLCCAAKADIVSRDELDTGERRVLNFGHTFGHALEKIYKYERYNHGEAVAVGMVLAAKTGMALGITGGDVLPTILSLCGRTGLDTNAEARADELVAAMRGDKKNKGEEIRLILLRKIGQPVETAVSERRLLSVMEEIDGYIG